MAQRSISISQAENVGICWLFLVARMSPDPWNSINYLSVIVALIMGAGSVWALNRKRVKSDKGKIDFLRRQNALAGEQNNELNAKLEEPEKRRDAYEARLPDTAWEKARADWVDGIERKANDTARDWIDREGDTISQLLLYRAIWTHQNSCGYPRPIGLVAAKAYAAAAVTLWPQNREAFELLNDLGNYLRIELGGDRRRRLSPP
jgi:hypothetical protein